jgi:hypothetical protein
MKEIYIRLDRNNLFFTTANKGKKIVSFENVKNKQNVESSISENQFLKSVTTHEQIQEAIQNHDNLFGKNRPNTLHK